jgi:hypothetical protein
MARGIPVASGSRFAADSRRHAYDSTQPITRQSTGEASIAEIVPAAGVWFVPIWPLTIGSGPAAPAIAPCAANVEAAHIAKNSRWARQPMLIIVGPHKVLAASR